MHNLTAKYNYLYHAHLILDDYEAKQRVSYATNFEEILSVYPIADSLNNTAAELDKVIEKAKTVIAEKGDTKYLADAYLLLAKANFLKGNYFLAQAYYEYVVSAYPENLSAEVQGLNGQARSLLQLNKFKLATPILNKLVSVLPAVKRIKAEPLATLAQANILRNDFTAAISYLEASLKEGGTKQDQLRRTYILAQLEERQKNYPKALYYYLKIQKSNAPFDLYFHSNLNRIKISEIGKQGINKQQELQALISDSKNTAYADQLYFELAETHVEAQNFDKAQQNYQLAIKANTTNNYQKGLIYQKMALLHAKHFKQYSQASVYYDSSLKALPKTYAGYEEVARQYKNMQYLASRYELITLQDSLQRIANLPETARKQKIESLFSLTSVVLAGQMETNPAAISKGASDFKKQWGNRKLEDNWRQSIRSTQTAVDHTLSTGLSDPDGVKEQIETQLQKMEAFESTLPSTPTLMAASNHKILEAYYQLGNFYAQEMGDQEEANKTFQILSHRFPNSLYAQTLLNPEWRVQKAAIERLQLQKYNEVYQAYENKNYQQVIDMVNQLTASPENNSTLAAQILYLQALAIGRTAPISDLSKAFDTIRQKHPNDPLVSPLILAHQNFIKQHLPAFQKRKIALINTDQDEPPLLKKPMAPDNTIALAIKQEDSLVAKTPIGPPSIFTTALAATYYFVVNVADASVTLSSSRFGIGQFNRGNYADYGLKHQLIEIDNEQLIYIGNFANFADVKTYAEGIRTQLKQIMKVKESDYTSFIISKENFDKITSEDLLHKYLEFYKNNY